jgi:hypothetical protein
VTFEFEINSRPTIHDTMKDPEELPYLDHQYRWFKLITQKQIRCRHALAALETVTMVPLLARQVPGPPQSRFDHRQVSLRHHPQVPSPLRRLQQATFVQPPHLPETTTEPPSHAPPRVPDPLSLFLPFHPPPPISQRCLLFWYCTRPGQGNQGSFQKPLEGIPDDLCDV